MKVLNLFAGIGGNRKYWNNNITAIEYNPKLAKVYSELYPKDNLIIGDAYSYLLEHYNEYDFIWASPPCQSHSKFIRSGKNRKPRYSDLRLYEIILFLQYNFKGNWLVENVVPYYKPLIEPTIKIGRHLFWSNFKITQINIDQPKNFITLGTVNGSKQLKEWLGIHYKGNIYYEENHDPCQVLRNCVHPNLGLHIMSCLNTSKINSIKV